MGEAVIAEHLRPALEDVYERARVCAEALGGDLDVHRLLTAPDKARKAYSELTHLAARRRMLFEARRQVNTVGHRVPEHDVQGMFVEFQSPHVLVPGFTPGSTGRWPGVPAPADDRERLLWVVSDAVAAARPWLPTVAEQDAAWDAVFGEAQQMRVQAQRDAAAIGARGDFRVS